MKAECIMTKPDGLTSSGSIRKLRDLVREKGIIRTRDVEAAGIHRAYLYLLRDRGELIRVARGLYQLADAPPLKHQTLAEACVRVPRGVGCLLTALAYHDLTTQLPHQVWMAIPRGSRPPRIVDIPVRFVYFSGNAMSEGIETHCHDGVKIRVYGVAKTIADCFKFRNKIGVDIAIEALQDGWRKQRFTMDELVHYAKICRVWTVMRPYVEAIQA